ncbi:MAG: ATP-dependent Clp protease ATP-binding subunit [Lachnospiraceae bacterium]|nr:ATP-dependent Clp protease ATP-binding subunit [Lachnospiraceae bacterium]
MQKQFTENAKKALTLASRAAGKLHQNYVGTEHILVGLLQENSGVAAQVLMENGVDAKKVIEIIKDLIAPDTDLLLKEKKGYSKRAQSVINESHIQAQRFHSMLTGTEHLLMAIIKEGDNVAVRLLNTLGFQTQKIYVDTLLAMGEDANLYKEDLVRHGGGKRKKEITALEQYSRDLTALAKEGKLDAVIGREDEIQRVIQILSRRMKNNPCLVGEPGVGKTSIVEGLARKIVAGEVPDTVKGKRVLMLDLSGMVAGSKYRGEFEERIKKLMKEVKEEGDVLLFMDEVHTLIGAGGAEGAIDASNILKPALARGELQMIGATTISEYRKHIEKDAALERRFQPVTVEEPEEAEAIRILEGIKENYEKHHKVTITKEAIEAAVQLSARYINDRNLPDKAIDLIDEASAAIRLKTIDKPVALSQLEEEIEALEVTMEEALVEENFVEAGHLKKQTKELRVQLEKQQKAYQKKCLQKQYVVTEQDIAGIVATWTKIPVKKLAEKESDRLLKLESILHKRVIGQSEAVTAVAKAMRRGRVGLQDPKKPIGSFLFLGPTGVGKTELSKALAEAMFGSEEALIRIDMSEYMEGHSVSKMIGSPPGYVGFDDGGQLSEKVRRNPYSVVLFDEIEKAHPDVFNILLQVLDDGHITDSKGRKVNFKNTILIMTSNAGAGRIVEPKNLGFGAASDAEKDYKRMKDNVMDEVKKMFKPEFINRIDEIMVFHPLKKEEMKEIVTLLSANLAKRCKEQMDITLTLTPAAKQYIVDTYSDAKMGARPLKRGILTAIEDPLAEEILKGNVKQSDTVVVGLKDKKIQFNVK